MSGVNELFQNIRFLKFYGWGQSFKLIHDIEIVFTDLLENFWAARSLRHREVELQWRVKENIVAILISFIWQVQNAWINMTHTHDSRSGSGYHLPWHYFHSCFTPLLLVVV